MTTPPTRSEFTRAMYPVLLMGVRASLPDDPRAAALPDAYDDCTDADREYLDGLVGAALAAEGIEAA